MKMAENQDLYDSGIQVLETLLQPQKVTRQHIEDKVRLRVDTLPKMRMHLGNLILYLYDFRQGEETEKTYLRAVDNTKKSSGSHHVESFVCQGTVAERLNVNKDIIGWYLSRF